MSAEYVMSADEQESVALQLLDAFHTETTNEEYYWRRHNWYDLDLRTFESGKAIIASSTDVQIRVLHLALARIDGLSVYDHTWQALRGLIFALYGHRLPFTADDLTHFVQIGLLGHPAIEGRAVRYSYFLEDALRATIRYAEANGLPDTLRALLVTHLDALRESRQDPALHRVIDRLKELAGMAREGEWEAGEPWVAAIRSSLDAMDADERDCWYALFALGTRVEGTKPSSAWLRQAMTHVDALGKDTFTAHIVAWFPLLDMPATNVLADRNSLILRGLAWACGSIEDVELSRALGKLAETMFRKIPGRGPRSRKAANACLYALSVMPGTEPIFQLSRLGLRVKGTQPQGDIGKAVETASRRIGLTREEIEEISVPTYCLDNNGRFQQTIGGYTAEIGIIGTTSTEIRWLTQEGKAQKSLPASVKKDHTNELKALRTTHNEIRKMLPAQRDRLERLLIADRSWNVATWRERYIDHPLLAQMTRRLIWHFQPSIGEGFLAIPYKGRLVDLHECPLDPLPEGTRVRLWHPLGFDPEIILRWRVWLEERNISQPFKQAHREVYLLTDAELATNTYSNRFAAHIVRQHQFKALCEQRGWRYHLQGNFDVPYNGIAVREIPERNLHAEFFADPAGETLTTAGIYLHVSTDQVRFRNPNNSLCPMADVPAIVLSEILRDVDLFVGVASIGSDPTWQDQGAEARYTTYWHDYAFGDLSASAESRRDVLTRLLPRLKIAPQCALQGRFLIVRGKLRTYKIHLGSSNILMEPNDHYLCIVPGRGDTLGGKEGNVTFLPFEGDATLSLILSKAFLLADDTRITDSTIRRQIGISGT
ncbi:MAG: DUF4132 domain-containing protein [Thermomicrobiales bacterium]